LWESIALAVLSMISGSIIIGTPHSVRKDQNLYCRNFNG
jgi:hypothetical protein